MKVTFKTQEIVDSYLKNDMNCRKAAEELGCNHSTVSRRIKEVIKDAEPEFVERLQMQKQKAQDLNRIKDKLFREESRSTNAIEAYNEQLIEVLKKNKPKKLPRFKLVKNKSVMVLQLSDLHFNEQVDLPHNKYNFTVAAQRLQMLVVKAKRYALAEGVRNVVVALTGDLLNSDRRLDELLSNATNRARGSFLAYEILRQVIVDLAEDLNVTVVNVNGNESRLDKDVGMIDLTASNNYDYTIFQMLAVTFQGTSVEFIQSNDSTEVVVNICGQNWLLIHGHLGMGKGGLTKAVLQIKGKYSARGIHIDYIIFGHIHEACVSDQFSRSSSLVGDNDYSDKGLHLAGRASQNIYFVYTNGNRDGVKVDLQNYDEYKGYNITEALACYNTKSASKLVQGKTIIEIRI